MKSCFQRSIIKRNFTASLLIIFQLRYFQVVLNGTEYKPNIASNNKKEAKAAAASLCLQKIGLLPTVPSTPISPS